MLFSGHQFVPPTNGNQAYDDEYSMSKLVAKIILLLYEYACDVSIVLTVTTLIVSRKETARNSVAPASSQLLKRIKYLLVVSGNRFFLNFFF